MIVALTDLSNSSTDQDVVPAAASPVRAATAPAEVITETPAVGPPDVDVDVDWPSPGDQGLPDGALTGGYCAKKWWC